jgi:chemotaxis methyl-accepting protein methylase
LLDSLGLSWRGYKKVRKGVKKRIARHMQENGVRSISAYLTLLKHDDIAMRECQIRLAVSISRFFRDRMLWRILETDILPNLVAQCPQKIRVWSAGCSRGEEVYTFRIVWDHICSGLDQTPLLEIVASDMAPDRIAQAKVGIYSTSSLKHVPDDVLSRYFEKVRGKNRYAVKAFIKDGIQWRLHNHQATPPDDCFHIIFLRNNLLTYFQDHLRRRPFEQICHCLVSGGWLIVGSHEKPPVSTPDLLRHRIAPWAYRKLA